MFESCIPTASYAEQVRAWPESGRHILASFDDASIIVYQAFRQSTARFAVEHGMFGDGFSYQRMSWIKPGFLWMMHRSSWGLSDGQQGVLAIRLRRTFFDEILAKATPADVREWPGGDQTAWRSALRGSQVRLQWDPDHAPGGERRARKAIQLGLRGDALVAYGKLEALEIIDMSGFVAAQRALRGRPGELMLPLQRVYQPADPRLAARLRLGA